MGYITEFNIKVYKHPGRERGKDDPEKNENKTAFGLFLFQYEVGEFNIFHSFLDFLGR